MRIRTSGRLGPCSRGALWWRQAQAAQTIGKCAEFQRTWLRPARDAYRHVVFDRSMLQIAQGITGGRAALTPGAGHQRRLEALRFDTYRYQRPAFYTPEAMAVADGLLPRGQGGSTWWTGTTAPANSAQPKTCAH